MIGNVPFLAPFWSYLDISSGSVSFRNSTDKSVIREALERFPDVDGDFSPRLLVVATWNEVIFIPSVANVCSVPLH
jgi:hypothetical protein